MKNIFQQFKSNGEDSKHLNSPKKSPRTSEKSNIFSPRKKTETEKTEKRMSRTSTRSLREQQHIEDDHQKIERLTLELQGFMQTSQRQELTISKLKKVLEEKELEIQNMKREQLKQKNINLLKSKENKKKINESESQQNSNGTSEDEEFVLDEFEFRKIKNENENLKLQLNDQKEENRLMKEKMRKLIDDQAVEYENQINDFIKEISELRADHLHELELLKIENKKLKSTNNITTKPEENNDHSKSYISKLEEQNLSLMKKVDSKQMEILKKEKSISRLNIQNRVRVSMARKIRDGLDDEIPFVTTDPGNSLGRFVSDVGYNSDDDAKEIIKDVIEKVKQKENLEIINFSKMNATDADIAELFEALIQTDNQNVKSIDLSYNEDIKGDAMDEIVSFLQKTTHLEELFLEGCPVRNFEVKKLISALRKNYTLIQCTAGLYETDMDIDIIEALLDRNYEKRLEDSK
eukprot:gene9230-1316_t